MGYVVERFVLPKSTCGIPITKVVVSGGRGSLGSGLGSECRALTNGISSLTQEAPESSLIPSSPRTVELLSVMQAQTGLLYRLNATDLMVSFLVSRTTKFPFNKLSHLFYFDTAAQRTKASAWLDK